MKLKSLIRRIAAALLMAGAAGGIATAAPVTVPDFSFELWTNTLTGDPLQDGANTAGPDVGPDWRAAGNGGINLVNPTNGLYAGTTGSPGTIPSTGDGMNYLWIGLGHDGHAWQTVGTLQPNTVYTLTVAVGNTLLNDGGMGTISLESGNFPAGTILGSAPVNSTIVTPGTFVDSTLVFITGQHASGPLTILLEGTGGTGTELNYDNIRLDASPAPASPTALVPFVSPSSNVYIGTLVTLNEDPAGTAPFTYRWQTDNGSGGATFSNIGGANATNYVVDTTSFVPGQPVEYQVIVSNSLGMSTSAPVTITAISGQPVLTSDTVPASGSDVVGSQVTFSATFDGSRPIFYQWQVDNGGGPVPITGATNTTLTLTNLQLTDTAAYSLLASNALGTLPSTEVPFTVNPVPPATNNIVITYANQLGLGGNRTFTPTWTISTNADLIAGSLPSAVGPGAFNDPQEHIGGTPVVLTDGKLATLYPEGITSPDVITGGTAGSGAGQYVIYTLPPSANGYDLTNIVSYGGWADAGRDEQRYTLYYSTVAAPTNFTAFADVLFNPFNPSSVQSATRATITPLAGVPLVKNVAALKFDFSTLNNGAENGFVGYSEIQVYGTNSAPAPIIASDTEPGSGSDVVGSQVTFTASFGGATSYQWQVDTGSGPVNIPGATNTTLTLTNLQLTNSGTYRLVASNASGTTPSTGSPFVVNSAPGPDGNGIVASPANQTGRGATYSPNYVIAPGSLIAGLSPSAIGGTGNFINEGGGGVAVLTDGVFGHVGSGNNSTLATCGVNPGGNSVTYTFTGSASGYDLTNIVTYGGWSDGGRDEQAYTISYSTVVAPATFIPLTTVDFLPSIPAGKPTTSRVTVAPAVGGPMATNVAAIKFDFTNPVGENGWEGYAELSVYGAASAPLPLPPTVTQDLLPHTGSDVVGSQVRFTAAFNGTAPIYYQWFKNGAIITGATSSVLTLNNLQAGDSAAYNLVASNALGVASTTTNSFTVNAVPAPVNGVIISPANQTDISGGFVPTWLLSSGSLIAGKSPSSVGTGSFTQEGAGGASVLTDGSLGTSGGSLTGFATCGSGAGGRSATYTLSGSTNGYNLTNITVYAGWGDSGRDQQAYTVSYATASAPATFIPLASVNFNPSIPGGTPSADRVTLTSATAGPLAANVVSVKFDYTNPAGENGYSGYDEIQVFGVPPAAAPISIHSPTVVSGNLVLTGTGGTPGAGYTWLTATNAATPRSQWTTNSTGTFDGTGSFSNSIPVGSGAGRFFLLRVP